MQKIKCQLKVTGGLLWPSQWSVERSEWGKGLGGCHLCNQNKSGWWLDVEEKTAASNDWIGYTLMLATINRPVI